MKVTDRKRKRNSQSMKVLNAEAIALKGTESGPGSQDKVLWVYKCKTWTPGFPRHF